MTPPTQPSKSLVAMAADLRAALSPGWRKLHDAQEKFLQAIENGQIMDACIAYAEFIQASKEHVTRIARGLTEVVTLLRVIDPAVLATLKGDPRFADLIDKAIARMPESAKLELLPDEVFASIEAFHDRVCHGGPDCDMERLLAAEKRRRQAARGG